MYSHYDRVFLDAGKAFYQSLTETVAITGLSLYELRSMEKEGTLPCTHTGNKTLVHVPMLLEYLEAKVFAQ